MNLRRILTYLKRTLHSFKLVPSHLLRFQFPLPSRLFIPRKDHVIIAEVFSQAFHNLCSATMWLIFEIFVVLFKIFLCYIEAVFRAIVRPSKKDIEGQTVLITGKANANYTCNIVRLRWVQSANSLLNGFCS